ncbi:MAG TPA: PfkB family carbohydrate kinase [Candidatus Elarobacter sp.]|jgi:pseudouridine kinase
MVSGARVACIGGAGIDRTFTVTGAPAGPSLRGRAVTRCGGVARNAAHNLTLLGVSAVLISLAGDDDDGRALVEELRRDGIDSRGVEIVSGASTAQYVAVIDGDGASVFEIADVAIFERFDRDRLARTWPLAAGAAWIVAETNMRLDVVAALAARTHGGSYRLALDAVSLPKAAELPAQLDGIDLLFLNAREAEAYLAAHDAAVPAGVVERAAAVRAHGASAVVLTDGSAGALVATNIGVVAVPAVRAARVVDVTGAGDALLAATIARLLAGDDLIAAVGVGVRAAALTVATNATVRTDLAQELRAS